MGDHGAVTGIGQTVRPVLIGCYVNSNGFEVVFDVIRMIGADFLVLPAILDKDGHLDRFHGALRIVIFHLGDKFFAQFAALGDDFVQPVVKQFPCVHGDVHHGPEQEHHNSFIVDGFQSEGGGYAACHENEFFKPARPCPIQNFF